MSSVFYRWGARKDESRVTFDGTHISVFDLKREIVLGNKMGNGKDFDIGIFDNVTGEGKFSRIHSPSTFWTREQAVMIDSCTLYPVTCCLAEGRGRG